MMTARVTLILLFVTVAAHGADTPETVPLPTPRMTGGKPLMDTLKERRSTREFSTKALPEQTIADLLWAAWGVNRSDTGKRTAPSSRNRQEIDVYTASAHGVHRYDAQGHALVPVLGDDIRKKAGGQAPPKTAPIILIYVADFAKMAEESDQEKWITAAADTGFIGQNVYLFCASENLGTVVRDPGSRRKPLAEKMGLRDSQHVVLTQAVGHPPKSPSE